MTDSLESSGHLRNLAEGQPYRTHLGSNISDLILAAGVDGPGEVECLEFHFLASVFCEFCSWAPGRVEEAAKLQPYRLLKQTQKIS